MINYSKNKFYVLYKIEYEEGINVNPSNRALLKNYFFFLLEIKQFDKFTTVLTHAKRVLDPTDIAQIQKIHSEFLKALGITA